MLLIVAGSSLAAPELTQAERQRLADGTSDRDGVLDQQDGLYVLLRNAAGWMGDDFAGDAGAAVAPPPDYAFIKANPQKARGNVYEITGWLVKQERFPTLDNHGRDKLVRAGDPDWGDQLTRWTVVTDKGDPAATILVLFNDPTAKMPTPASESKVRIAARFFKLWTLNDVNGKPFDYPVFVGGAAEVIREASSGSSSSGPGSRTMITLGLVAVGGAFFVIRVMLKRKGGGNLTLQRIEAMRRERQRFDEHEQDDEELDEDLPEDPGEALEVLHDRHDS